MSNSVQAAAKSGDKLATLLALRDSLASTIDGCESGRDMAALSKRLMEVMDEIQAIEETVQPKDTPMSRRRALRDA